MWVLCNPDLDRSPQTHHSLNKKNKWSHLGLVSQDHHNPIAPQACLNWTYCSSLRQFLPVWMPKISAKELFSRYFNLAETDFALPINLCYKKQLSAHARRGNRLSKQIWTHPLSEGHCTWTGSQEPHDEFTSATTCPITSLFFTWGPVILQSASWVFCSRPLLS